MVYIKTAIVTVIVCIGIIIGLMFATFDADYELEVAQDAFLKEEYGKAENTLNRLEGAIPATNLYLYRAYIARAQGNVKLSQINLTEAISSLRDESATPVTLEIYLNRCFNAYLLQDWALLSKGIIETQGSFSHSPWVSFFEGVYQYYGKADMPQAQIAFNNAASKTPLSAWMKKAFGGVFTPLWEKLRLTHCYIEQGNYLSARQMLEQQDTALTEQEQSDVNLLIGITYLKEAKEKPIKAALPYYKLAFSYFDKVPLLQQRFQNERTQIVTQLAQVTSELISDGTLRDVPFYATVLENLKASSQLDSIKIQLVKQLDREIEAKQWTNVHNISALLNRVIVDPNMREQLSDRFEELLVHLIDDGRCDLLNYYWEIIRLFNKDLDALAARISELTTAKILQTIPNDDSSLTLTNGYLAFLKNIEQNGEALSILAKDLVACSEMLWLKKDQVDKAGLLMKKALNLTPSDNQKAVRQSIENALSSIYEKAIQNDDLDQLPAILDLARNHQFKNLTIDDTSHINEHLKIAATLYNKGDWDKADQRVRWILHLDPKNEQATFLNGMIAYSQGNYTKGLGILEHLEKPSKSAEEAIAVCQYLVGDRNWGRQKLELLTLENAINNETFLRIGFALLHAGNPTGSVEWFARVNPANDEVFSGLAYSAYQMRNWEKVVAYLDRLSEPYNQIGELQLLAAKAFKQLGKEEIANNRLKAALSAPETNPSTFSQPFSLFFKQQLASLASEATPVPLADKSPAKEITDSPEKTENAFTDPSLKHCLEMLNERDFDAAYKEALQLKSSGLPKETFLPLLARAAAGTDRLVEADEYFREYLSQNSNDSTSRLHWATTLMQLRQYEKALEQFLMIRNTQALPAQFLSAYISCLVHTDHKDEAVEQTQLWLRKGIAKDPLLKLSLLQEMVIPGANGLIINTLRTIPPVNRLSTEEKIELGRLLFAMGRINRAYQVVKSDEEALKSDVRGQVLLTNLYQCLSKPEAALKMAQKVLKTDPMDEAMIAYLYGNEKNPTHQRDYLRKLSAMRKKENLSVREKQILARTLISLSRAAANTPGADRDNFYVELRETYFLIDQLAETYPKVPEFHYLLGELAYLTRYKDRAMKHYSQAVTLDPSYSDALRSLGNLYRIENDINTAREKLTEAVKYQPSNAGLWLDLAALHLDRADFYEAKLALYNAIKYRPGATDAYVSLARVLLELKNPEDAKVILERAVKMSPNNIDALKLLLACLYDRSISKKLIPSPSKLRSQKAAIYDRIYAIDPTEAQNTFELLDENAPGPMEEGGLHQQLVK